MAADATTPPDVPPTPEQAFGAVMENLEAAKRSELPTYERLIGAGRTIKSAAEDIDRMPLERPDAAELSDAGTLSFIIYPEDIIRGDRPKREHSPKLELSFREELTATGTGTPELEAQIVATPRSSAMGKFDGMGIASNRRDLALRLIAGTFDAVKSADSAGAIKSVAFVVPKDSAFNEVFELAGLRLDDEGKADAMQPAREFNRIVIRGENFDTALDKFKAIALAELKADLDAKEADPTVIPDELEDPEFTDPDAGLGKDATPAKKTGFVAFAKRHPRMTGVFALGLATTPIFTKLMNDARKPDRGAKSQPSDTAIVNSPVPGAFPTVPGSQTTTSLLGMGRPAMDSTVVPIAVKPTAPETTTTTEATTTTMADLDSSPKDGVIDSNARFSLRDGGPDTPADMGLASREVFEMIEGKLTRVIELKDVSAESSAYVPWAANPTDMGGPRQTVNMRDLAIQSLASDGGRLASLVKFGQTSKEVLLETRKVMSYIGDDGAVVHVRIMEPELVVVNPQEAPARLAQLNKVNPAVPTIAPTTVGG